jgi:magnesium-transporting ATPase (P-type)
MGTRFSHVICFSVLHLNSQQTHVILYSINTVIGIYQEGAAEKAADALKAMLSTDAVVIRNGVNVKIPAEQLVPGDMVRLHLGDRVPADLRMIEVTNLAAQEAALTGESVPVDKTVAPIVVAGGADPNSQPLGDRHNMCFSATLISSGSGTGLVVSTGDQTEIGTINTLVNKVEKVSAAVVPNASEYIPVDPIYLVLTIYNFGLCATEKVQRAQTN